MELANDRTKGHLPPASPNPISFNQKPQYISERVYRWKNFVINTQLAFILVRLCVTI